MPKKRSRAVRWGIIGLLLLAAVVFCSWIAPRLGGLESAVRSVEAKVASLTSRAQDDKQAVASGIDELHNLLAQYLPATISGTTNQTASPPSAQVQAIARRVKPSVVDVTAVLWRSAWQTSEALGTGVIYTSDGLIITNNHVLTGDGEGLARTVSVTLASGARMSATIVGRDPTHDLAILRVRAKGLHPAVFDTSLASRKPGTLVVALGNDQVLGQPVVNGDIMGLVSGVQLGGRSSADPVLATSVPLMQGDSGGPLVDSAGRVIGINFAELTGERAGLALPAGLVLQVTRKLVGGSKT